MLVVPFLTVSLQAALFLAAVVLLYFIGSHYKLIGNFFTSFFSGGILHFKHGEANKDLNMELAAFSSLHLGVLYFDTNGKCRFHNRSALELLDLKEPPGSVTDILTMFGHIQGIKSLFLMPVNGKSVTFSIRPDRSINFAVKVNMQDTRILNTVIVVQDFTQEELQNKQRKEFVANVSHELKTPITTIKAYTELLLDWGIKEKSKEQIADDIKKIRDDAMRMEALVGDLLLLSSIDGNRRQPKVELIEVEPLIHDLIERFSLQAVEKNIKINCYILNKVPMVFAEAESLERAFGNIISNGIKYGVPNGKIDIYISCLIDDVTIKFADNGIGIAQEHLRYIFNRFYRVDNSGTRQHGGTGLGLSIVQELIKMHHGEIFVQSVLGSGTEFTVILPSEGSMYRSTIAAAHDPDFENDLWYKAAKKELLIQAKEYGVKIDDIANVSEADLKVILEQ